MAGWSMVADDGTILYSSEALRKAPNHELRCKLELDLDESSCVATEGGNVDEIRSLFDKFIGVFLKEFCGDRCYRPLPAMIEDGQCVDLFKLFLVVREKGGYDLVSRKGLWDVVAGESGFSLKFASVIKLIYVKYLYMLERWLGRVLTDKKSEKGSGNGNIDSDSDAFLVQLEEELSSFLSRISHQTKKNEGGPPLKLMYGLERSEIGDLCEYEKTIVTNVGSCDGDMVSCMMKMNDTTKCTIQLNTQVVRESFPDFEMTDVDELDDAKICINNDEEVICRKRSIGEGVICQKRKRDSIWEMLNWVTKTSKNPCDPALGVIPESLKWNSYGNDVHWKQVLSARDALLLKREVDSSVRHSIWQRKQKMHPSMYDDHIESTNGLSEKRCSERLLFVKNPQAKNSPETPSLLTQSNSNKKNRSPCMEETADPLPKDSTENIFFNMRRQKKVPICASFQAIVPQWTGEKSKSDTKWLGTKIWPLGEGEKRSMIEMERTGKGRQDSCGCALQGSVECVQFHASEKRMRLKCELGSAFYVWNVHKMGEDVKLSWSIQEEDKFKSIVKSNLSSSERSFWNKMFKLFPTRSREALVSYYFNVFLLRLRSDQNRTTPDDIDSDDDESELGPVAKVFGRQVANSSSSILYSPNKTHKNPR